MFAVLRYHRDFMELIAHSAVLPHDVASAGSL